MAKLAIPIPAEPGADFGNFLHATGWQQFDGGFYRCRYCHQSLYHVLAWVSPGWAFYHQKCLMQAPTVRETYRAWWRKTHPEDAKLLDPGARDV